MASSFEQDCRAYFARAKNTEKHETNEDIKKLFIKAFAKAKIERGIVFVGNCLKSYGKDIVASPALDHAVIKKYDSVPLPQKKVEDFEHMFIMNQKSGFFSPSRHFTVPGNGGSINFGCYLGYPVDWSSVVAVGHTHPLYKDHSVNRVNKYFSAGDPLILFIKDIPIYLRTPKGKEIKVLEIRDNWVTTRKVSLTKTYKAKHWSAKG